MPDLNHSRPLDVHVWSDHPEVNLLVSEIWERLFRLGDEEADKRVYGDRRCGYSWNIAIPLPYLPGLKIPRGLMLPEKFLSRGTSPPTVVWRSHDFTRFTPTARDPRQSRGPWACAVL